MPCPSKPRTISGKRNEHSANLLWVPNYHLIWLTVRVLCLHAAARIQTAVVVLSSENTNWSYADSLLSHAADMPLTTHRFFPYSFSCATLRRCVGITPDYPSLLLSPPTRERSREHFRRCSVAGESGFSLCRVEVIPVSVFVPARTRRDACLCRSQHFYRRRVRQVWLATRPPLPSLAYMVCIATVRVSARPSPFPWERGGKGKRLTACSVKRRCYI